MARDEAYQQAENKIEAALTEEGVRALDLSDMGLTELPEAIGQLTSLTSLNIQTNQLSFLPDCICELVNLQNLSAYDNLLSTLPASIGNLTQLRFLDLYKNRLFFLPQSFYQLQQLLQLRLDRNQLEHLPEALGQFKKLQVLNLSYNRLARVPESLGELTELQELDISRNALSSLPRSLTQLRQLQSLHLTGNQLTTLPETIGQLTRLYRLSLDANRLSALPESIGQLTRLQVLNLFNNKLNDLPTSLGRLDQLKKLRLEQNPLNLELGAANRQGLEAVKVYLRAKDQGGSVLLNEAKLILIGEGEVGKTCLMDALLGNPWQEHSTTHGINIMPIKITDPDTNAEIVLNGWDFGGQPVYRPTHQLFFTPAVYLVVWKPRQGHQQGFVQEWIQLILRREPSAKIIVVATHGGPQQRQPDINRQELWDLFGRDTVIDFFHVESKPNEQGQRPGIDELRQAIARVASTLPEVGRSVPKRWQEVRDALKKTEAAFLPLANVYEICRTHKMEEAEISLFIKNSTVLGHLVHYEHDPVLRDIIILKPDWLANAISLILEDDVTRSANGLIRLSRLHMLWEDPNSVGTFRYDPALYPIFLRLMERFDLFYQVAEPSGKNSADPLYLIAQLVPDIRPESLDQSWPARLSNGDFQQTQVCRIVDAKKGQSARAEGLFYRLIVRLHKYSLGREDYHKSLHWQNGLLLDAGYNGRALLEYIDHNVRITVRAAYPEWLLAILTSEVKYLIENFWEGMRCDVMVPCIAPCGRKEPGLGMFEVEKLIAFRKQDMKVFPCMVPGCSQTQNIDLLLHHTPVTAGVAIEALFNEFDDVKRGLAAIYQKIQTEQAMTQDWFQKLNTNDQRLLSRVDEVMTGILHAFADEARDGPRLFSLVPVERKAFNPREWVRAKFRLTLWCEYAYRPLPELNEDQTKGVYEFELEREWFKKIAPYLKIMTGTLSLVLPVTLAGVKLHLDEAAYKAIEEQLDFGKSIIEAAIGEPEKIAAFYGAAISSQLEQGEAIRAQGATLRELHAMLKTRDPGFGGLVRVMNKRQEFLWVHKQFAESYQ